MYCSEIRETKDKSYSLNVAGVTAAVYYASLYPFENRQLKQAGRRNVSK